MKKLSEFKDTDIYSLSLFVLYQLTEIPEYSINAELPYILDKNNLLNFCTYFGGRTIKVPTISELNSILHIVLLYHYISVEYKTFDEAFELVKYKKEDYNKIKHLYNKLLDILDKYNFGR